MRLHKRSLRIALLLTFLASFAPGNEKAEEQGHALLRAAAEQSLLRADGKSPVRLKFSFHAPGSDSKRIQGTYDWLVSDSAAWRKELVFPDYARVEVGHRFTVWEKRNVDYNPVQAVWVEAIFANYQYLDYPDDTIERYYTTSDHGLQLRCVDIRRDRKPRTLCVDPEGNLSRVAVGELNVAFHYSDYRPLGQKFYPHSITLKRDGKAVLEVEVQDVSLDGKSDSGQFDPPIGAIKRAGCFAPTLPRVTKSAFPEYPFVARQMGQQGIVTMYVLIASDGTLRNSRVIETAGKEATGRCCP